MSSSGVQITDGRYPAAQASPLNQRTLLRVRDMPKIPGQEEVYPMDGGDGHVQRVEPCLGRKCGQRLKAPREAGRRVVHVQEWKTGDVGEAAPRWSGIASTSFVEHHLRDVEVEARTAGHPPIVRQLLTSSSDHVARRTGGEIGEDGILKVEAGHAENVTPGDLPP